VSGTLVYNVELGAVIDQVVSITRLDRVAVKHDRQRLLFLLISLTVCSDRVTYGRLADELESSDHGSS